MKTRREQIMQLMEECGIKTKVVAEGIGMKPMTLSNYFCTNLPVKYEIKIINFLKKMSIKVLEETSKMAAESYK